jgi:hypothetical protein
MRDVQRAIILVVLFDVVPAEPTAPAFGRPDGASRDDDMIGVRITK